MDVDHGRFLTEPAVGRFGARRDRRGGAIVAAIAAWSSGTFLAVPAPSAEVTGVQPWPTAYWRNRSQHANE
jgi:hypothetical protein